MTRVFLVRHAPIPHTGNILTGRAPGLSLADDGQQAAERLARDLARHDIDAIYTSPMERTAETAEIIAAPHRLRPTPAEDLTEVDFGDWTGSSLESLRELADWETVQTSPSRFRFPGGESFVEAQERAVAYLERIAAQHPQATLIAVSHADIIKLALSRYLGQQMDHFQRLRISTASVSEICVRPERTPVVVSVNDTGAHR